MTTLYIMCGVGFSGKSTLAKNIAEHFSIPLVSLDALYFEKEKELNLNDYDDARQWEILLGICKEKISTILAGGQSVVFDNVNLTRKHRDELRVIAQQAGGQSVIIFLDTPEKLLDERQEKNKATGERHDVEQHYLDEAKKKLEPPSTDEQPRIFTPATDRELFIQSLPH